METNTNEWLDDRGARLVAYALGELDAQQRAAVARELAASAEARAELERVEAVLGLVRTSLADEPRLSPEARAATLAAARPATQWWRTKSFAAAASVTALVGGATWLHYTVRMDSPTYLAVAEQAPRGEAVLRAKAEEADPAARRANEAATGGETPVDRGAALGDLPGLAKASAAPAEKNNAVTLNFTPAQGGQRLDAQAASAGQRPGDETRFGLIVSATSAPAGGAVHNAAPAAPPVTGGALAGLGYTGGTGGLPAAGGGGGGVPVTISGAQSLSFGGRKQRSETKAKGAAPASTVPPGAPAGRPSGPSSAGPAGLSAAPAPTKADAGGLVLGLPPQQERTEDLRRKLQDAKPAGDQQADKDGADRLGEELAQEEAARPRTWAELGADERAAAVEAEFQRIRGGCIPMPEELPRDMYFRFWGDNPFEVSLLDKQSTFGVDVDTASYALARRYVAEGNLPEKAQVRTEEFVNYFKADVPAPTSGPFAVRTDLAPSRFSADPSRQLLRVAVRAKDLSVFERKPLRLTFVVDVSGSMREQNRLETVKDALRLLVAQLEPGDRMAIVKFSADAAKVLDMTSTADKLAFEQAIQPLQPEGGTNSNAGLQLGYALAMGAYDAACVNRVVFLSDGVATVGETDPLKIVEGVKPLREKGIYLNTIGVGMNNHNDTMLEQLADKGDGVCTYVDSPKEAKRALVDNFTGAFQPVGRDVKVQVEFDPAQVLRWRQLGYENRAIADADFRDDKVDAGEIGAGHQMTALYELELAQPGGEKPLAVVRLRWKDPVKTDEDKAHELETAVAWSSRTGFEGAGQAYRRAAIVAQYAEFLRQSTHTDGETVDDLVAEAKRLQQEIPQDADWNEFVGIVEKAKALGLGTKPACDELCDLEARLRRMHWRRYERVRLAASGHATAADDYDRQIEQLEGGLKRLVEQRLAAQK